jgi:hypothetical protein
MMTQKTWQKKLVKAVVLISGAAMTMGNQKCQQTQTETRTLKKIVQLGTVTASPLLLPGNNSFDFQFVANQQIYGVLSTNDHYALKYTGIVSNPATTTSNALTSVFKLSSTDSKMMTAMESTTAGGYAVQDAQTAWCMVNLPQAKISGGINSFELVGGGGLSIGYTPAGAITSGLAGASASVNIQSAQLDLSMQAYAPLTSTLLAASNVTAKQTKTNIGLTINFGLWSVGPSAFYQTPLATVTKNALTSAVNGLDTQLQTQEWFTRVMANYDTHLVIVGGTDLNLEVGDQLLVYNEDYFWDGEPCNSNYLGGGAAASSAVAKIELDWVGDEISRGKVIEQNDNNAVIGAKVKLFKFHDPNYVPPAAGVQPVDPTTGATTTSTTASSN